MGIYFNFPVGWWLTTAIIYIPYFVIFICRKSYKKKNELTNQLKFGIASLVIAFLIEFVSISLNLWNYTGGNWPFILWFDYFGAGLFGFQLIKFFEEMKK